jgi:thiamine biosynthesis lipoprotein
MGSPCDIQIFSEYLILAKQIANIAIADIERLEAKYSRYRQDSLLSQINQVAAKGGSITVDEETASLLNYADTCYQQSDGLFDITSGVLRKAWQFNINTLPSDAQISELLNHVGWHKINWSTPTLNFLESGMEIDFGGIVKEYAADRAAELCRNAGAVHGIINLGGDLKIIGPRPDARPWQIGINHPRQSHTVLYTLSLQHGAMATSGDYQRYILIDGIRYTHLINPKTGYPVNKLASVSVVSDYCVIAGSASTIGILKEQEGPAWLTNMGLPHLWVDSNGKQGGSLTNSA